MRKCHWHTGCKVRGVRRRWSSVGLLRGYRGVYPDTDKLAVQGRKSQPGDAVPDGTWRAL